MPLNLQMPPSTQSLQTPAFSKVPARQATSTDWVPLWMT